MLFSIFSLQTCACTLTVPRACLRACNKCMSLGEVKKENKWVHQLRTHVQCTCVLSWCTTSSFLGRVLTYDILFKKQQKNIEINYSKGSFYWLFYLWHVLKSLVNPLEILQETQGYPEPGNGKQIISRTNYTTLST